MKNKTWLNLPIREVKPSKEFFKKLGASFVEQETETMFGIYLGENKVQIMFFTHPEFKQFTQAEVANTSTSAELLISLEANSKDEVDEMAQNVLDAGEKYKVLIYGMAGCMVYYSRIWMGIDGIWHIWTGTTCPSDLLSWSSSKDFFTWIRETVDSQITSFYSHCIILSELCSA